ncbi:Piso0_005874 [Millerozyma farinosa CBS 7064]|uniref:Piso0_005874 protein n=1 Tax=Pichia sorbitophila (strain ATCC MYA-4447 / BCRC 22081 / CBS 7064 / NBRC 10061 / NRRL Y-12695) TaxID=559304 RepID=G8Y067_PICSO|nr:Piso0_005874 [Millerozyma farinosa CBS 7064]
MFRTFLRRTGFCSKGSQCKYIHDKQSIKLCRSYLSNVCYNKNCLLSHTPNQFNAPLCRYFLENKCTNTKCQFIHSKPNKYDEKGVNISVCRPFAISGFCARGLKCPFLHLFICPDFEEEGVCPRGKTCSLSHPKTQKIQSLMVNANTGKSVDDIVAESDSEDKDETVEISSYTVDPALLFVNNMSGKYDIYIDNNSVAIKPSSGDATDTPDSNFMIEWDSDSDADSEKETSIKELDSLEENDDYIKF